MLYLGQSLLNVPSRVIQQCLLGIIVKSKASDAALGIAAAKAPRLVLSQR